MNVPRSLAVVALLVLGVVALPLLASVLDGQGTENWILPAHLLLLAVVGAVVWRAVPAPAGVEVPPTRATLVGAGIGLLASVLGLLVFFFLLSGFSGA